MSFKAIERALGLALNTSTIVLAITVFGDMICFRNSFSWSQAVFDGVQNSLVSVASTNQTSDEFLTSDLPFNVDFSIKRLRD